MEKPDFVALKCFRFKPREANIAIDSSESELIRPKHLCTDVELIVSVGRRSGAPDLDLKVLRWCLSFFDDSDGFLFWIVWN